MGRARELGAAAAATITLSVALASCSSGGSSAETSTTTTAATASQQSSQSASQIAAASRAAMQSLTSARVVGIVRTGGQNVQTNMILTSSTSAGTFAFGKSAIEVLVSGDTAYARANEAFWVSTGAPAAIAARLADRWVTGIPSAATSGFTSQLSLQSFVSSTFNDVTLTKGPTTTVGGQSAIPLTVTNGVVGYVAAEGTPYLLKVTGGTSTKGTLFIDEFNSARTPTVPANPLNFSSLKV
jgi:hypothetical protein